MIVFFCNLCSVPFAFGPDLLLKKGLCLDEETSSYMITCMGLANMLGQIGVGALADLPWVNSSVVSGLAMIVSGLSVSLMPNCQTYVQVIQSLLHFLCFLCYIRKPWEAIILFCFDSKR